MEIKKIILITLWLFSAFYLAAQPVITKSVSPITCNNSDGAISASVSGGLPPYLYEWRVGAGPVFSNSSSISGLSPGMYSLSVTDANNDNDSIFIMLDNGLSAYFNNFTSAVCPLNNGSVGLMVSGGTMPYSYNWSNGSTSSTASNLPGGSVVQVQVSDANGCYAYFYDQATGTYIASGETTIGLTSSITATYTTTPEQCPLNNGTITLHPTGGVAPYTYYWNTSPVQTGQTATGLSQGSYTATVRGSDGCGSTIYTYVNANPGTLAVSVTKTNDYCTRLQGTASLTISGGVSPYDVHWPDGSTALSRTDLGYGLYAVDVTDQNNCVFRSMIFINDDSPVSTSIFPTNTGCDNISGAALANVSGGAAPYTYKWNTGATTASILNLPSDYYRVEVKDANGCSAKAWTSVEINATCYGYVSGKVFQDNNGNCIQESGEYPILNSLVYINATTSHKRLYDSYAWANFTGAYSARYVLPDDYSVLYRDDVRTAACLPAGQHEISIPVSGVNYPNKDFAMEPAWLEEDVTVFRNCTMSEPRPGFNYYYNFAYKNIGTIFSDGYIELVYGDLETFVSSTPAADSYDPATKTLRFNYSTLMLGEIRSVQVIFHIPATTLLGSTYSHSITATTATADRSPENNVRICDFTVVGSFDPNDLAVSPKGILTEMDSVLTYTIRFQNTGTYPAELVVVKDTLEGDLDITSIRNITSSHNFRFRVLENRAVEFAFPDINLPDSTRNEPGSHGYVSYSIHRNKQLSPGTTIHNRAEIYFDFNEPVVTNTTTNTMAQATATKERAAASQGKVYPNPAKEFTELSFEKDISSVQLMNASGIVVLAQKINNQKEFRLELAFSKGMYFYTAYSPEGDAYSGKLIVE